MWKFIKIKVSFQILIGFEVKFSQKLVILNKYL